MKKLTTLSILFISLAFVVPIQVSAATNAGVKPGSLFYFLDTTFENVGLFFTFSPEKKAQKALEHADERLAEIEAIAEEKNPDAIKTAIANYESNIAMATEKSKEVKDKGQAETLLTSIADNSSRNQEVLAAVLIKVPEEAKEAITQAIEASRKGQEEATKQIAELKSEIEQLKKEVAELKKESNNPQANEVEKLKKEVEELKKKQSATQSAPKQPTPTIQNSHEQKRIEEKPKTTTTTLPNGAVVEMDTGGNIIRYIKQPNAIITPVTSTVQDSQSIPIQTPSCQVDTWSCENWSSCSVSGSQTRGCTKTFDCSSVNTPSPISSQSCTPPIQTQTEISTLNISTNVPVTTTNSAQISWNTNIPSSAKVFLTLDNGSIQVILSVAGYSTQHLVNVSNLKSDTQYSYTIEAIVGTQVKKVTNVIKTKWEDPYSDYVFVNTSQAVGDDSQWQIRFSIAPTTRDIRVKKAVFKVNDEDAGKLDAIGNTVGGSPLWLGLYVRNNILYYTAELVRTDKNTFTYMATNGSSGISLGQISFPLFLGLYTLSSATFDKALIANIEVPMSEWVIMDQSNGKQVKTW